MILRVAACAALGLASPIVAYAACRIETLEMPIKMVGSRAVATIGINGTSVPLTVDSGAFYSLLTDAVAQQLNLSTKRSPVRIEGIAGRAETRMTTVDKLQLLKGEIEKVVFFVGGNEPGAGTMGLLGRNILSVTDTEYDLAHGVIRFIFPSSDCAKSNMAYWAGSSPVSEVEFYNDFRNGGKQPAIRAQAKLNGSRLVALFDTGATTVVSAQAARNAGVAEADMKPAGVSYGIGRGTVKSWTASFDSFEMGGEAIRNNRLRVSDFELGNADMLLGIDFFLSHRIYISNQQSKIFFTYNGGPVFSLAQAEAGKAPTAAEPVGEATTADQFARRSAASAARREFESALADLNRACELEPASAAYLAQRGGIEEALKKPEKALADYDRAIELDAAQTDARFRRAQLRFAAKDRDGAKADMDALDRMLPAQSSLRLPMSQFYLRTEQPAQALAQLNQWLPAHPSEIRRDVALNGRCTARLMLGIELDRALDDCDDAVGADATNAGYLDTRGWVYLRTGKDRKALADFDRSIELRPANAAALYGRGLAKGRLGETTQGEADLAAARKLQPEIDARLARGGITTGSVPPR